MRGTLIRASLAIAVATALVVAQAPDRASAATCGTTLGASWTLVTCLDAPAADATVSGEIVVTASVTKTTGAPNVTKVRFDLVTGPDVGYLLTDYEAPYTFVLETWRWVDGPVTIRATPIVTGVTTGAAETAVVFANGTTTPYVNTASFVPRAGRPAEPGEPFVVAAVGDAASGRARTRLVADQIASWNPNLFLYLGDVYEKGSPTEYRNWWGAPDEAFGRLDGVTNPTPGNHEYQLDASASGYLDQWDNPPHHYAVDTAGWHIVSIDSNTTYAGRKPGTAQFEWLRQDLAAHADGCTVVFAHHPRWGTGSHGSDAGMADLWSLMVSSGVDLFLAGHHHNYERWVPLDAAGQPDPSGLTEVIVGTGGHEADAAAADPRLAAAFSSMPNAAGALRMTLRDGAADLSYVNVNGGVLDTSTLACRTPPPPEPTPTDAFADGFETGSLSGWVDVAGAISVDANAASEGTYSARVVSTSSGIADAVAVLAAPLTDVTTTVSFRLDSLGSSVDLLRLQPTAGASILRAFIASDRTLMLRNDVTATNIPGSVKIALGAWHSLRIHTVVAGTASRTEVSLDGVPVPALARTMNLGTAPIRRVMIGNNIRGRVFSMRVDDVRVTTPSVDPDVTPPDAPTGLSATATGPTSVALSWTAASDDVGVTGYEVLRDDVPIATDVATTTYTDTTAAPATPYRYVVRAVDGTGNVSLDSAPATTTTPPRPTALFSDGFESGLVPPWTTVAGAMTRVAGGDASAWAARAATSGGVANVMTQLASTYGEVWVRASFQVVQQGPNSVNLLRVQNASGTPIVTPFLSTSGALIVRNDVAGTNVSSSVVPSRGTWHDLVVRVKVAGTASELEVWLDGVRQSALSKTLNLGTASVGRLLLGESVKGRTATVLYDDVAISTSPLT